MYSAKNAQLQLDRKLQQAQHTQNVYNNALAAINAATPVTTRPETFVFDSAANSYHNQVTIAGVTQHRFNLDIKTLVQSIENWKDVNPRTIKDQDNHVKLGILSTLRDNPEKLVMRNNGLTLTAKSVTIDPLTCKVTVKMTDKELHGLLNGGHTTHWILKVADEMKKAGTFDSWNGYVPVVVYVGFKTKGDVAELSDSLNTNVAVPRSTAAHMRGKYDLLIEALKDKHYYNDIAFKGSTGKVKLQELFRILVAFDKHNYPTGKSNPIRVDLETSKKGKGSFTAILDEQYAADFLPEQNSAGVVTKHNNSMKMLFENADTFLRLRDQLTRAMLEDNMKIITNVVSGGRAPKRMVDKRAASLKFLKGDVKVKGHQWNGWIFPIINAFRANVEWNATSELIDWTVPNTQLTKAALPEMLKYLVKRHKEKDSNPANLLRDADTYEALYEIADKHIAEIVAKS